MKGFAERMELPYPDTSDGGTVPADKALEGFVKHLEIPYPVAMDREKRTVKAFHVDSFPDYYVIDRTGRLRFADLANSELDRAVASLLAEKPATGDDAGARPDAEKVLDGALARAAKEDKHVLVHIGAPG